MEICRINRFLEGKRSVNALFGENKKLLCYPRKVQTAAFLIQMRNARFINYDYNFRREIGDSIVSLNELDGLPRKLIYRSDELEIDTDVFEGLELIDSDTEKPEPRRRVKLETITNMIPENVCYTFSNVVLLLPDGDSEAFFTCIHCASMDDVLSISEVGSFIRRHCAAEKIIINVRMYRIGRGQAAEPLPLEIFTAMQETPHISDWLRLPGYQELPGAWQYTLDSVFMHSYMRAVSTQNQMGSKQKQAA